MGVLLRDVIFEALLKLFFSVNDGWKSENIVKGLLKGPKLEGVCNTFYDCKFSSQTLAV